MNPPIIAKLARIAAAVSVCALAACQSAPPPPASAPPPSAVAPNIVQAQPPYQPILPLPRNASLHDIFVRNGVVVGEPDPSAPDDPGVRILHGLPYQAKVLFKDLTKGGRLVRSPIGAAYRLPGGAVLTYHEDKVKDGSFTRIANVKIFVNAPGVPVTELRFSTPPSAMASCPPGAYCDGGGGM